VPEIPDFDRLEEVLGYTFVNRELLVTALTHRSFANENRALGRTDNEKLEFLGDAVLDLVVGERLMNGFPEASEGELSVTRAQVVSEAGLSAVARELGLGQYLFLGRGEAQTGGREKPSLLADAFEAVIAAVYLDGGFEAARELVHRVLGERIDNVETTGFYDFKTRLQEAAQARLRATPVYRVVAEEGPDHDKTFVVAVVINDHEWGRAAGKSKKSAEQRAAASAAFLLEGADAETIEKRKAPE
jgi:ribonuclease III